MFTSDRGESGSRSVRRARRVVPALLLPLALGLSGCRVHMSAADPDSSSPAASGAAASSAASAPPPGPVRSGTDTLVVEPDQGLQPVYSLISGADHSIDLTMYELVDTKAEQALAAAAHRGVDVRVVLDHGLEAKRNKPAYTYLTGHGVHVAWASSRYRVTHQKTLVVDGKVAAVMTLNLTTEYYASSRDFAVIDRDPSDITAIEQVFDADFKGTTTGTPAGHDLVWSPKQSETVLLGLIKDAHHTLTVDEEMADTDVVAALSAAAKRGVTVTVIMTRSTSWNSNFDKLTTAGVHVRTYKSDASRYIHAKVIMVDYGQSDQEAFVGSENFSVTSLEKNRELGLDLTDHTVLAQLDHTLTTDADDATAWSSSS